MPLRAPGLAAIHTPRPVTLDHVRAALAPAQGVPSMTLLRGLAWCTHYAWGPPGQDAAGPAGPLPPVRGGPLWPLWLLLAAVCGGGAALLLLLPVPARPAGAGPFNFIVNGRAPPVPLG